MAQTAFILILTENPERGQRLHELLKQRHGHACKVVGELSDALDSIRARTPDVVVADRNGHDAEDYTALLDALSTRTKDAELITVGRDGPPLKSPDVRVSALPPAPDPEEWVEPIGRVASKAVARREDRRLKESLDEQQYEIFEGIVGVSPQMHKIVEQIRKAARNKLTVLILGDTGTGKELIARAIHNQSDRARKPFQTINCAAIPHELIESQLFGHVKGAFTGAVADSKGHFVAADGGTLFLDEIGDMPMVMQAKLLRALERREITPVGSTEIRRVDVRLIAATHADVRERVEQQRFREDLFYRLNQWRIVVPPLRERKQDIPLLAHFFLKKANRENNLTVDGISSEAMGQLTRYYWPGNVRELSSVIEVAACSVIDRQIEVDDLPEELRGSRDIVPLISGTLAGLTLDQVERIFIERALQATSGNREQAAKMLGIGTRTLYRKIKEYGL